MAEKDKAEAIAALDAGGADSAVGGRAIDVGPTEEHSNGNNDDVPKTYDELGRSLQAWGQALPGRAWRARPVELFSWKRWLAFGVLFGATLVMFKFLPTNTERLVTEDNPNPTVNWYAMVPPILCIYVSIFFRQVLLSLGLGILVGGAIVYEGNIWTAFEQLVWVNLYSRFNGYIIGFTVSLVGMIFVMHRAGGLDGMLRKIMVFARTPWSTRVVCGIAGLMFFFDDYGNSVVVGTTFKTLTDKMWISREKLAYIVDSTAAPVAGVAIISTWISYELSLFDEAKETLNINKSAYDIFLTVMPMRFYCFSALVCVFSSALLNRDFGPMLAAERRAALEGKVKADDAKPMVADLSARTKPDSDAVYDWRVAVWPLLTVVVGSLVGLFISGESAVVDAGESRSIWNGTAWRLALGAADSAYVLFCASMAGGALAVVLSIYYNRLGFDQCVAAYFSAVPAMLLPVTILVLAWSIKSTCDAIGSAQYLVALLNDLNPDYLPLIVFILSALTGFATGTSWGTMGILLPISMQLAYDLGTKDPANGETGLTDQSTTILWLTTAAVLDGAIMGDHCSPISDTTVLSSACCDCDHVAHVTTQIPYAVWSGTVAMLIGYLSVAKGMPVWAYFVVGTIIHVGFFMLFAAKTPTATKIGTPAEDPGKYGLIPGMVMKMIGRA